MVLYQVVETDEYEPNDVRATFTTQEEALKALLFFVERDKRIAQRVVDDTKDAEFPRDDPSEYYSIFEIQTIPVYFSFDVWLKEFRKDYDIYEDTVVSSEAKAEGVADSDS